MHFAHLKGSYARSSYSSLTNLMIALHGELRKPLLLSFLEIREYQLPRTGMLKYPPLKTLPSQGSPSILNHSKYRNKSGSFNISF